MFIDQRSPFQRQQDDKRCPCCGHRPQDALDDLDCASGASYTIKRCPTCGGRGSLPDPGSSAQMACPDCAGTGSVPA